MISRYEDTLASLASLRVQEQYIVHGTKDEYLLPEELLDHALDITRLIEMFPHETSSAERAALAQFSNALEAELKAIALGPGITAETLVYRDPAWAKVREAARKCLEAVGFDLWRWEQKQRVGSSA